MRVLTVLVSSWLAFSFALSADDRSFFHGAPVRTTYPNSVTLLDNGAFVVGYDETRRPRAENTLAEFGAVENSPQAAGDGARVCGQRDA